MSAATAAFGQTYTQSLSFDNGVGPGNAGTYNPNDSFSFDIFLTYPGYTSSGFSMWFDTTANAAPHLSLTGFTYGTTFFKGNPFVTLPLGFTVPREEVSIRFRT